MSALLRYLLGISLLLLTGGVIAQIPDFPDDWKTDTAQRSIALEELEIMLPRDRIAPIDEPRFLRVSNARHQRLEQEPVLVVKVGAVQKAYPLSMLLRHELVNDLVGGKPLLISYCPLCNAALVFSREVEIDGELRLLDFGVSGLLRKSDMIMWDRQSESWWQQLTGEALVGEMTGTTLRPFPAQLMTWQAFAAAYPEGWLLQAPPQGANYAVNPYPGYDADASQHPRLFHGELSARLDPIERVISIPTVEGPVIYPERILAARGWLEDQIDEKELLFIFQPEALSVLDHRQIEKSRAVGSVLVFDRRLGDQTLHFKKEGEELTDLETGSRWNTIGECIAGSLEGKRLKIPVYGHHFAFAVLAFYPKARIYGEAE